MDKLITEFNSNLEAAPYGKEVLLLLSSGYSTYSGHAIVSGYRLQDTHDGDWLDMTGERLTDKYEKVLGWTELEDWELQGGEALKTAFLIAYKKITGNEWEDDTLPPVTEMQKFVDVWERLDNQLHNWRYYGSNI